MKKTLTVICALILTAFLTGCGEKKEEPAKNEIINPTAVTEIFSLTDAVHKAVPDAETLFPLNEEDLMDELGIGSDLYSEFVFLKSNNGMDGREILVIRAKNESASGEIRKAAESYLQRRRDEARNYAPEAYELLTAAKVQVKGKTVALIVGADADAETNVLLAGE